MAWALPPLDDGNGPARKLTDREHAAFIDRAIDTALALPTAAPRRASGIWKYAVAAASIFIMAGGATAGVLAYRHVERERVKALEEERAVPKRVRRQAHTRASMPALAIPAAAPAPPPRPPRETPPPAAVRPSLRKLLDTAAELRGARRWSEAAAAYQRVMRAAPNSDLAHTAAVAVGFLQLEHLGDPAGARRSFRSVVVAAPAGPLGEESRWGMIEAMRTLGDRQGERQALLSFLSAHPESIRRPRVNARLVELSRTPPGQ